MARTRVTPQAPTFGQASTVTFASANVDGHMVEQKRNDVVLLVRNAGGSSVTVTIPAVNTNRGGDDIYPKQTTPDIVLTVAAGATGMVTAIPDSHLSNGDFNVNFSDVTSVTVAAFKMPL